MHEVTDYKNRIKHTLDKADKYTQRKSGKNRQEMALIKSALPALNNVKTLLDAPCGTGRMTIMLSRNGYQVTGIDLGKAAVDVAKRELAKAGCDAELLQADIEHLPWPPRHFDAVLCFRLFHHFPDARTRAAMIHHICDAADNYVLLSYLSPWSWTALRRQLRRYLTGRKSVQHHTSLNEIADYFTREGFSLVKNYPVKPFFHSLHLAVFQRQPAATTAENTENTLPNKQIQTATRTA